MSGAAMGLVVWFVLCLDVLRLVVAAVLAGGDGRGLVVVAAAWSGWAGGEAGEGLAAPSAGFGG